MLMKKNSHIHIVIETEYMAKLRKEAEEKGITLSELCRQKLRCYTQLDKIEIMFEKFLKNAEENSIKSNN